MALLRHFKRLLALWYFIKYQRSGKTDSSAKKWLSQFFQQEKGLLLKLGQIWGTSEDLKEILFVTDFTEKNDDIGLVKKIIENDLQNSFDYFFNGLKLLNDKASLSKIYLTKLNNYEHVVIKIKRPHIEALIEEQFSFLKFIYFLQKLTPFKKFQFDFQSYLDECQAMVSQELDYLQEARSQDSFSSLNSHRTQVLVPKIYPQFVFDQWFVQSYISADDYTIVLDKWPLQKKEALVYVFCQTFLEQLFLDGRIQGDSHLGNYLFSQHEDLHERIVFLDFGAHLSLSETERKALLCLFDLVHKTELSSQRICQILAALEFDEKKLSTLGPLLVSAIQQMLYFLSVDKRSLIKQPSMPSLEDILQNKKWILRSSGPPRFLQIMRAFYGLSSLLKKANIPLNFYQIYENFRTTHPDLLLNVQLPQTKGAYMETTTQAKNLKIIVKKKSSTVVDLTLPVTSIYDLEDLLPASAATTLSSMGIDIEEIKRLAIQKGLVAQVLFEWDSDEKSYQVLLV